MSTKTRAKKVKKEKAFFEENILIHLETKDQKEVFQSLCKVFNISFKVEAKEEKYSPYDPEFVKKIQKSRENIKAGRYYTVDLKNLWNEEAWKKSDSWK